MKTQHPKESGAGLIAPVLDGMSELWNYLWHLSPLDLDFGIEYTSTPLNFLLLAAQRSLINSETGRCVIQTLGRKKEPGSFRERVGEVAL